PGPKPQALSDRPHTRIPRGRSACGSVENSSHGDPREIGIASPAHLILELIRLQKTKAFDSAGTARDSALDYEPVAAPSYTRVGELTFRHRHLTLRAGREAARPVLGGILYARALLGNLMPRPEVEHGPIELHRSLLSAHGALARGSRRRRNVDAFGTHRRNVTSRTRLAASVTLHLSAPTLALSFDALAQRGFRIFALLGIQNPSPLEVRRAARVSVVRERGRARHDEQQQAQRATNNSHRATRQCG